MCIWFIYLYYIIVLVTQLSSLVAQMVKHLPAMQETQVQSLTWEDLLEKEMATHSSTLTLRIPWMEEPGRLQFHGVAKSQTWLSDFTFTQNYSIYQSGVLGPAASALPGSLLKMQIHGPHFRPTESEALGMQLSTLCFSNPLPQETGTVVLKLGCTLDSSGGPWGPLRRY